MKSWPDESIYEGNRLALPDEVVNFKRGDGLEKAFTLLNVLKSRHMDAHLDCHEGKARIKGIGMSFEFTYSKTLVVSV